MNIPESLTNTNRQEMHEETFKVFSGDEDELTKELLNLQNEGEDRNRTGAKISILVTFSIGFPFRLLIRLLV